ncbi:aquaporin [Shigella boydii]
MRAGAFAPIAIGLALTLIHLISIPVTNTYLNPRAAPRYLSSGRLGIKTTVVLLGGAIVGGIIGDLIDRTLLEKRD